MNSLSQAALLSIGRLLKDTDLLDSTNRIRAEHQAGLIIGTRRGSLETDLAYGETVAAGPEFISPALFGYTLPNIPLAEVAIHYNVTGPVFSLFSENPATDAVKISKEWLSDPSTGCTFIIAGSLDSIPLNNETNVSTHFTICYA
jgi:3-oxoacyl-(acyl-carrier-protein) synthase